MSSITMRLSDANINMIKTTIAQWEPDARVYLFGSRTDDQQAGGDIDLLIETSEPVDNPALTIAQLSARLIRQLQGRKVDIVLSAPNLARHEIHRQAKSNGIAL